MTKKPKRVSFTIKLSRWIHGTETTEPRESALRLENGEMCCLGFYMREVQGVIKKQLISCCYPSDLGLEATPVWLRRVENAIARLNDAAGYTLEDRKKLVAKKFLEHGNVRVRYVP